MTETDKDSRALRPIRSYVVRGGRLTPSQQKAIESQWPRFGLERGQGEVGREQLFGRHAPLVLEIGFGMGDSLVEMARRHPEQDFIGVDVHLPGIGTLLRGIQEHELENVRVCQDDAKQLLSEAIADGGLDRVLVFFPDPWHKKRHHKRRLIQPDFVQLLRRKLAPGGILHLATDWENYAEQMMEVLSAAEGFQNCFGPGQFAHQHDRPVTKFEKRGQRLGHGVWDLLFTRTS